MKSLRPYNNHFIVGQIYRLISMLDNCRGIRSQDVFAFTESQNQRASLFGADKHIGKIAANNRQSERAGKLPKGLLYRPFESVLAAVQAVSFILVAFGIEVADKGGDDLGIRLADKSGTFIFQPGF